ncbi:MAG: DHHA1 domain-containing protein [Ignisphaera sp.]
MSYLITHTDADGVAAAALYTYLVGDNHKVVFVEPYNLKKALYRVYKKRPKHVAIFDLGLNADTIDFAAGVVELLRGKGAEITWFDHHVWEDDWIKRVVGTGAKLFIDRSTCATGVVAKYVTPTRPVDQAFVKELVDAVCGADLWRFDHRLSPFFMRLIRRGDTDEWRLHIYETLSRGVIWTEELEDKVVKRFEEEVEELSKKPLTRILEKNGVRVAITLKSQKVENSILASRVMSIAGADIAIVVDRSGKISLRSRGFDVRKIAVALGGGGHKTAAGAKIDIPIHIKILGMLDNDIILKYVENIIEKHI